MIYLFRGWNAWLNVYVRSIWSVYVGSMRDGHFDHAHCWRVPLGCLANPQGKKRLVTPGLVSPQIEQAWPCCKLTIQGMRCFCPILLQNTELQFCRHAYQGVCFDSLLNLLSILSCFWHLLCSHPSTGICIFQHLKCISSRCQCEMHTFQRMTYCVKKG